MANLDIRVFKEKQLAKQMKKTLPLLVFDVYLSTFPKILPALVLHLNKDIHNNYHIPKDGFSFVP